MFTVPEEIAAIAYQNKEVVYGILFRATAETLQTIAADPKHLGAEIGFFAVLHSWGSNLMHHPHLHCVVPGGGISPDGGHWIYCKPHFFLPVRVLSSRFRRLFLKYLQEAFDAGKLHFFTALENLRDDRHFLRYLAPLRKKKWVWGNPKGFLRGHTAAAEDAHHFTSKEPQTFGPILAFEIAYYLTGVSTQRVSASQT